MADKKIVFVIINENLAVSDDTSIPAVFEKLEDAMKYCLDDVISHNGKNIKSHNFKMEGIEYSEDRISNNTCLGSDYGITYNSYWGNYPCSRMAYAIELR